MAAEVAYYAILGERSAGGAAGLARRTFTPAGRLDEALRKDLTWERDSAIYEWERGEELGAGLLKISEAEAGSLIDRLRVTWGGTS